MALLLETCWGDLVIDLDIEGSPELCKNILKLAKARFYTNMLIYSVQPHRFFRTGCPVGNGTGGTSIYGLLDTVAAVNTDPKDAPDDGTQNGGGAKPPSRIRVDYRTSPRRFLKSSTPASGRPLTVTQCQEKGRVVAALTGSVVDTIGSQFWITTHSGPDRALDGYQPYVNTNTADHSSISAGQELAQQQQHVPFLSLGIVTEDDQGVLDRIAAAYTDPEGRPYADIRIRRALVVHDPFPDPPGLAALLQDRGVVLTKDSPPTGEATQPGEKDSGHSIINHDRRVIDSPTPERPGEESVPPRISIEEVDVDEEGDEAENLQKRREREEEAARRQDHSRAVVLEMLGDLPSADIRAPENVLFICKLNPITQDEDLELILSRFDPQVKVEIIRDHDTGQSLCYAFAEFTLQQQAAECYFKMNNALIDDRRIKVDFSQSVAKIWDRYHQRLRMPRADAQGRFESHPTTHHQHDKKPYPPKARTSKPAGARDHDLPPREQFPDRRSDRAFDRNYDDDRRRAHPRQEFERNRQAEPMRPYQRFDGDTRPSERYHHHDRRDDRRNHDSDRHQRRQENDHHRRKAYEDKDCESEQTGRDKKRRRERRNRSRDSEDERRDRDRSRKHKKRRNDDSTGEELDDDDSYRGKHRDHRRSDGRGRHRDERADDEDSRRHRRKEKKERRPRSNEGEDADDRDYHKKHRARRDY